MSNNAFDKITEGLHEALAIARGEKKPARSSGDPGGRELSLTDEQVAEVHRRRADPNRKLVSHRAAHRRIKRFGK